MKHNYVPDGCFLLARQIFESAIWRDDPHVLKLFIYLMGQARHNIKPKKYPSFEIKRGELVTSLAKISEENEYSQNGTIKTWARMKISRMLDLLEKQGYIKRLCDTYGTHVNICNYNVYQDMNNYRCDTVDTQVGSSCDTSVTGVLLNNKDNKEKNDKKEKTAHEIYFEEFWEIAPARNSKKLDKAAAEKKFMNLKADDLANVIVAIHNYADSEMVKQGTGIKDPHRFLSNRDNKEYWKEWMEPEIKNSKSKGFQTKESRNSQAEEEYLNEVFGNEHSEIDITPKRGELA